MLVLVLALVRVGQAPAAVLADRCGGRIEDRGRDPGPCWCSCAARPAGEGRWDDWLTPGEMTAELRTRGELARVTLFDCLVAVLDIWADSGGAD